MNGSSLGRHGASSTQRHNAGDLGQARSFHPSLPLQEKFSDEKSSPVQGHHGWLAAMWYQPLLSESPGGQCLYELERAHPPPSAPMVFLGTKWCGAGVAPCWRGCREGGEGMIGLSGSPSMCCTQPVAAATAPLVLLREADALPCATSASIYPRHHLIVL